MGTVGVSPESAKSCLPKKLSEKGRTGPGAPKSVFKKQVFLMLVKFFWGQIGGLSVRRGVRSDAQLSCTETRFQKCCKSGKKGSKHPMLSISMAYNVI